MSRITRIFFELIQISIGNKAGFDKAPTDKEWAQLYDLACMQSLVSVALEGVNKLKTANPNLNIDINMLLEWICIQQQIIAKNQLLNEKAKELCELFDREGIRSCVLKGQGTALYYEHPEVRQCGDIDLWVKTRKDSANISDILETVDGLGFKYDGITIQHANVHFFNDVTVEIHFLPTFMYNYFTNKRLERFIREKEAAQFNNKDDEAGFPHTTIDFDLVFSIVHIYRHIFSEGIGLRQLMDYYYILMHASDDQRKDAFEVLKSLKMANFVGGIMWILHECFGMSEKYQICPVNKKHGKFQLTEIMLSGNFGQYDERVHRIDHNKRFGRGFVQLKRNLRFVGYYPSEVLWSPLWKLWHWCWRKKKGYL